MPQQSVRALGSRYQLEELLGSGAMGQVWRARDLRTQDVVAAKLLREELATDPQLVGRFVQERSILVELVHPHIVGVRDLVVDGGDLGIVMDLVAGRDLRAHLAEHGTLAPAEAVRITVDVLTALAAAHARGVLHRDVKPDNVLLDEATPPFVRLTDFGIARLAQETTVRMTGVLGTAEYIAPEVFTAETVSAAADVYGAGIQLYELLAGRTPFAGKGSAYAVAYRHVTTPPPPLPGLPGPLAAVLTSMLAKDPAERPTAAAAAAALQAAGGALRGAAPLTPLPAPYWDDAAAAPDHVQVRGTPSARPREAQATSLKGELARPRAARPLAGPQPGAALAPTPAPEALDSRTQLHGPRVARPVVDVPEAPAPAVPPRHRRTALVAAVAVLGVVVLAGGGYLLFARHHGHHAAATAKTQAITAVTADAPLESDAAGLTVARRASYDTTTKQLRVSLTYSASSATLPGPFFEAIPVTQRGGTCPSAVTWQGGGGVRDTTAGIDASACGWQVTPAAVQQGAPVTVTYTMPFTPPTGNPQSDVGTYVSAEATATGAALASLTAGPAYPAQRLAAVQVDVTTPALDQPIQVAAYPVWTSGSAADELDPLYLTASPAQTSLGAALGGVSAPYSTDCGSAIGQHGRVAYANTPASSCTITLTVGGRPQQSSGTFDISGTGG